MENVGGAGIESIALNWMIRAGLSEEVTFDQRSDKGQTLQRSESQFK